MVSTNGKVKPKLGVLIVVFGVLLLMCAGFATWLAMPAFSYARTHASMHWMKQIGQAIHNYEDVYRTFPYAYWLREDGSAHASWRQSIAPFLAGTVEGKNSEKKRKPLDPDLPWDHPTNLDAAKDYDDLFTSPYVDGEGLTTYKAVVGPPFDSRNGARGETLFSYVKATRYSEITDGSANTLMVVEDVNNPVPWNRPSDLSVVEFWNLYRAEESDLGGILVSTGDAEVHFIEYGKDETIKALLFCSDGVRPENFLKTVQTQ